MIAEGAAVVDVGGESSRPGSDPVSLEEELQRVIPVIRALHAEYPRLLVSIDTYKAETARQALEAGASIVNDVSGLRHPEMAKVVANHGAFVIIGHWAGAPDDRLLSDSLRAGLTAKMELALAAGVALERIAVDPGLGMGKSWRQNFEGLCHLDQLRSLEVDRGTADPLRALSRIKTTPGATKEVGAGVVALTALAPPGRRAAPPLREPLVAV